MYDCLFASLYIVVFTDVLTILVYAQVWNRVHMQFEVPRDPIERMGLSGLSRLIQGPKVGLDDEDAKQKQDFLGSNDTLFVPASFSQLLIREIASWFYLYQWITYTVWFWFSYVIPIESFALYIDYNHAADIWW